MCFFDIGEDGNAKVRASSQALVRFTFLLEMFRTNRLIDSLMKFLVHRGALVTSMQTLLLISFYAFPTRLHWYGSL